MTNTYNTIHPTLILFQPELIYEFFTKEVDNFLRLSHLDTTTKVGFFLEAGEGAMNQRSFFAEFFRQKNVAIIFPGIQKIILNHFKKLSEPWTPGEKKNKEWMKVDFKPTLRSIFIDIVDMVLFGEDDLSKVPKINGIRFGYFIEKYLFSFFKIVKNPLTPLTFGLSHKLNILKDSRTNNELYKLIEAKFWEILEDRKTNKKKNSNLIDMMVTANQKAVKAGKEELLHKDQMIHNCLLFYVAGADTSRSISTSTLFLLSEYPQLQKTIYEEVTTQVTGFNDFENQALDYSKAKTLDCFFKETIRLYGPAGAVYLRKALRDVKVGDIKIKKGTRVSFPINGMHRSSEFFSNPNEYDPNRFKKENKTSSMSKTFIPFSAGRRGCLGKYVGETLVKTIITAMLKEFELKRAEDFDPLWIGHFGLELDESIAMIRPR